MKKAMNELISSKIGFIKRMHKMVTYKIKSVVEDKINESINKLGPLEQVASKRKPIGSKWKQISMDQCNVDIHQIKELRASSYIETPSKSKIQN